MIKRSWIRAGFLATAPVLVLVLAVACDDGGGGTREDADVIDTPQEDTPTDPDQTDDGVAEDVVPEDTATEDTAADDTVTDEVPPDEVEQNEAPLTLFAAQVNGTGGVMMWQTTFYTLQQSDPEKRCYYREVGPCSILDCRSSKYGPEGPYWVSVGPVTITTHSLYEIVMEPFETGVYLTHHGAGTMWFPGDSITFSAPGDELPDFNVDLVMPTPMDTLVPDMESSIDAITFSRSEALTMTWEPTDGEVGIEIGESQEGTGTQTMTDFIDVGCFFPGSSGTGEIPLEIMSELEGGQLISFICLEHLNRQQEPLGERTLIVGAGHVVCRNAVIE